MAIQIMDLASKNVFSPQIVTFDKILHKAKVQCSFDLSN